MFETSKPLRALIKKLVLEQEERDNKQSKERDEQNEEQEIKELFQHWIDKYKASYLAHRKNVHSNSLIPTRMLIKELNNFIYISPNFEENDRNDWSIIIYSKEDKNIYCVNTYCVNTQVLTPAFAFALTGTFALALTYYVEHGYMSKVSVDQFRRVIDVTKGNYAQFEALTSRLNEKNK